MNIEREFKNTIWRDRIAIAVMILGLVVFFGGFAVYLPMFDFLSDLGLGRTILLNLGVSLFGIFLNVLGSILDSWNKGMAFNSLVSSLTSQRGSD